MKKTKKITAREVAKRMATLTQGYLDKFPREERKRRLKAFQAVVAETASLEKDPYDTPATSQRAGRIPTSRVAARGRG